MTTQSKRTVAFALCGSFCSFAAVLPQLRVLTARGWDVQPVLSASAAGLDTRFGTASALQQTLYEVTGHRPLTTLQAVEPLGPQRLAEALIFAPATGTTMALLAAGISSTPVTLAAKSLLRGGRPIIIAPSTNDGLSGSAPALGQLLQRRSYYFVPFGQDDSYKKPCSLKSDIPLQPATLAAALRGVQIQAEYPAPEQKKEEKKAKAKVLMGKPIPKRAVFTPMNELTLESGNVTREGEVVAVISREIA